MYLGGAANGGDMGGEGMDTGGEREGMDQGGSKEEKGGVTIWGLFHNKKGKKW